MLTYERLTTTGAPRRAHVSEQTIRTWLRSGLLPAEVTPLGALFDPGDVDAVIEARARRQRERIRTRQIGRTTD